MTHGTFHDSRLAWVSLTWPIQVRRSNQSWSLQESSLAHSTPTNLTHLKSLYDACMFPLFSTKFIITCWSHQLSSPCGYLQLFILSQRGHYGHHGEPPAQTNLLPQSILAPSKLLPKGIPTEWEVDPNIYIYIDWIRFATDFFYSLLKKRDIRLESQQVQGWPFGLWTANAFKETFDSVLPDWPDIITYAQLQRCTCAHYTRYCDHYRHGRVYTFKFEEGILQTSLWSSSSMLHRLIVNWTTTFCVEPLQGSFQKMKSVKVSRHSVWLT